MFAARKTDNVSSAANYIEDVFSTYLYTGNGATQTITNNIDLSGKGGLVWIKDRAGTYSGQAHQLTDTVRGYNSQLSSNSTGSASSNTNYVSSFSSTGFVLGNSSSVNGTSTTWASWTFRKQAKFFDVVTYTGNGANRTIAHNLGSVPGCIIVKRTDTTAAWAVYHRSLANTEYLVLNTTAAKATGATYWNSTTPTSTVFSLGTSTDVNANGGTYVAYLFAHDAGGFGATGTDNVISCGASTSDGSGNATVTLGWEPQFILVRAVAAGNDWIVVDNMRGLNASGSGSALIPNTTVAEYGALGSALKINSTGFTTSGAFGANATCIYIAIRRGPMKTPTSGTSVFSPVAYTGDGANNRAITTGFVPDMVWWKSRSNGTDWKDATLLIGTGRALTQNTTGAEGSVAGYYINTYNNTGFTYGTSDSSYNTNTWTYVVEGFSRAPGFFDVVCYTETGVARAQPHNLGVVPELIIQKSRSVAADWTVSFNFTATTQNFAKLNLANAALINQTYASIGEMTAAPTATNVNLNAAYPTNTTLVMYLFATVAGVSKVGSYTGNGSSQTINCGFAAGARFILIKRTDSTGDWYVWDTARGIVAGNDPRLSINTTAAEVTTDDSIDPDNSGFIVNQLAATNINVSSATYIYLAIA